MYKQENKAGVREFLKVLAMAFAAVVVSEFLGGLVKYISGGIINAALTGHIILAAMCVGMVILVYNHYASVYNYKITKKHIVIEKKTGRKVWEYDIPIDEIKKAYIRKGRMKIKAKGKKRRLCSSMFGYKRTSVIICGEEESVVIFEPDDIFVEKMKEYIND